jgi:hypothetical protein
MNQKVVLPRFDLPGDSTRVAMRALWTAGGLMVVATLVLGVAMWHRRSVEIATAEQAAAKAAAARRAALMPPAPPPVAPAKVAAPATAPLVGGSQTTMAAVVPTAAPAEMPRRSAGARSRHGKSVGHARGAARAASSPAASKGGSPVSGKKSRVDDDFIDKLLSK